MTGVTVTHTGGRKITTVVATTGPSPGTTQALSYADTTVIGNGSFGVVFQVNLLATGERVAIKKVLQDKRFKVGAHPPPGHSRYCRSRRCPATPQQLTRVFWFLVVAIVML